MNLRGWGLLSSGGGQAFSSISRTILLAQLARSFQPHAGVLCAGTQHRELGTYQRFSQGSTCLLYKAVNQQQAPSVKLRPAPALLRLDLFYLKEPFEVELLMHMESSCLELAGEHTNGGELFHMAVPCFVLKGSYFFHAYCVCGWHLCMGKLYSVLTLFTHVPNEVLFYLL